MTVCGGIKSDKMPRKAVLKHIRELAHQSNINAYFMDLIDTRPMNSTLYFFGECETPADIEAVCKRMADTVERNRDLLEGVGFVLDGIK